MRHLPAPYLVPMPDGRLMDTPAIASSGEIECWSLAGLTKGSRVTVDSRDGQMKGEHGLVSIPTYNVMFGKNSWGQVQWDWVQKDYDGTA